MVHNHQLENLVSAFFLKEVFHLVQLSAQTHLEKKHKKEEEIETILNLKIQKDEVQGKEKEQLSNLSTCCSYPF
jgi:hypothetical protein